MICGRLERYPAEDGSEEIRILRRLDIDRRAESANDNGGTKIGIVVDVETTGIDAVGDAITELALRRFRFDDDGRITKIDSPYSWLEDPGRPLDSLISAMTGLTDDMVRDRRIDDEVAVSLLRSAHVCIAFNAAFDRKFIERRLPQIAGLPWACAMREVDWRKRGFDGSGHSLGWILAQCGWFNDRAHRAAGDVDATVAILEHCCWMRGTALFELLEAASQSTWIIAAVGAHFDVKGRLKARGYRWDPTEAVWSREVSDADRSAEELWLTENVYHPDCRPRTDGPSVREVDWFTRHG